MKKGFVAISSVLVIGAAALIIGIVVVLFSVSEGQISLSGQRREAVLNLVEACVEDTLYLINTQNVVNTSVVLPTGGCSVSVNSHVGNTWTYAVTGSVNGYTKSIQIIVTRGSKLTPISWKEI